MNGIAVNDFGTASSNLLKVRADGRMNCHVSPVIYKIRDHGPAILDGEFYKDSAAGLPGAARTSTVATVPAPAAAAPAVSQLSGTGRYRLMLFSIALLTVALVSVGFYAYQQKLHVNDLQAELKIYQDPDQDF